MSEDTLMLIAIKIALRNNIGNLVESRVVEQQATQHRLLGLNRMGRHAQLGNRRIDRRFARVERLGHEYQSKGKSISRPKKRPCDGARPFSER